MTKINFVNGQPPALSENTLNQLQTNIENAISEIKLALHPIGSIEINVSGANPSTYIGGTWQLWGQGRVPVGVDTNDSDFNTVEKTGGEKEHTMTLEELVDHTHVLAGSEGTAHNKIETAAYGSSTSGNNIILSHTGRRTAIQHPTKIHNLLHVEENSIGGVEVDEILKIVISYLIPTVLGSLLGFLSTKLKKDRRKDKAVEEGVQALLRNELIRRYREYKIKGEMTILDRENIEAMYEQYKNLGGNGTVKELMDELLDVKTKVIK